MNIIKQYKNSFKCLECGNKLFYKDIIHNEFYCRSCGLIHDNNMLDISQQALKKDLIKENQENNPLLIMLEIERQKELNKMEL